MKDGKTKELIENNVFAPVYSFKTIFSSTNGTEVPIEDVNSNVKSIYDDLVAEYVKNITINKDGDKITITEDK